MKEKEHRGLIKLRRVTGEKPTHNCPNCRCNRYSPCYCRRAE